MVMHEVPRLLKFSSLLLFLLIVFGCELTNKSSPSLSVTISSMLYINLENYQNYQVNGSCVGEGLEISYNVADKIGSTRCRNKKWITDEINLDDVDDGSVSIEVSFTNGKKMVKTTASVAKDTVAPMLLPEDIGIPVNDRYILGGLLEFTLEFTEKVIVYAGDAPMALVLTVGESTRYARYVMGTRTQTLTFQYMVQGGDEDSDGIELSTTINLNNSAIKRYGR